jgi:hypothetical protein
VRERDCLKRECVRVCVLAFESDEQSSERFPERPPSFCSCLVVCAKLDEKTYPRELLSVPLFLNCIARDLA